MANYTGTSAGDTYTGTPDADTISGVGGNDTLNGAGGDDTIRGGDGNDVLIGGEGNDQLRPGAGVDDVRGGAGDDVIYIDSGAEVSPNELVDGGSGYDKIVADADIANLSTWSLVGIEAIENANSSGRVYVTAAQFDALNYANGIFELTTGGNVSLAGMTSTTTILILSAAGATVDMRGHVGFAGVSGREGNDIVIGSDIRDGFYGRAGDDQINAGDGNDELDGGSGVDIVRGEGGDDLIMVDPFDGVAVGDVFDGGVGYDTLKTSGSLLDLTGATITGIERLLGFGGASALLTRAQLTGFSAFDDIVVKIADGGSISMAGIEMDSALILSDAGNQIDLAGATHSSDNTSITVIGGDGDDVITGHSGIDELNGGRGNDTLQGAGGADSLIGHDGNDWLDGGAGADGMNGGLGDDTYVVDNASDTVVENAGEGTDTVRTSLVTYAVGANVENLTYIGNSAFTAYGNALNNLIDASAGGAHNDMLQGGAGNDVLIGGDGDDQLRPGAGVDEVRGGAGDDLIYVDGPSEVAPNELVDGGSGYDKIVVGLSAEVNLSSWTLTGIEAIEGSSSGRVYVTAAQYDALSYANWTFELTTGGAISMAGMNSPSTILILSAAGNSVDMRGHVGFAGVNGRAGNDVIIGSDIADTMSGGAGDDQLSGGDGNDTLYGGVGVDTMLGGAGDDWISLSQIADLEPGDVIDGGTGYDILSLGDGKYDLSRNSITGLEELAGSSFYTSVVVTHAQASGFSAFNVALEIADGGAVSLAGATVSGAGVIKLAAAGNQLDLAGAVRGADLQLIFVKGNAGNDTVTGHSGADAIDGLGGNDTLRGGDGNDSLSGGDGDDLLDGGAGSDTMTGGLGFDTYVFGAGDTIVENADEGHDLVLTALANYTIGANLEDVRYTGTGVFTGTGNELGNGLDGGDGNDTLIGLGGVDRLFGGFGADTMIGGADGDYYVVDSVGDVIIELAGEGIDSVHTALTTYTLAANVERLTFLGTYQNGVIQSIQGTGNAQDNDISTIYAGDAPSGNDVLYGLAGNDTLYTGAGNDLLDGGEGTDTMYGGIGDDIYYVDNVSDAAIELAGEGTDTVRASISYTLGATLENLTLTGTAAINGVGNAFDNVLIGNDGANDLDGLGGNDRMEGGLGDDVYHVDDAGDVVVEAAGAGNDKVVTGVSFTLGAGVSIETVVTRNPGAVDAINITGNELANTIEGNAAGNTLNGGGGNDTLRGLDGGDTLDGGTGADMLFGGAGNDLYTVDNAGDQVIELAGEGVDTVRTGLAIYTVAANVEGLAYTGTGSFNGTGNASDNTMVGGAGLDTLRGMDGNDILDGRQGADTMYGGAGNDTYLIDYAGDVTTELAGEGVDTVKTALTTWTLAANVENLTYTGTAAATFTGNAEGNTIQAGGATANVTLRGMTGNDSLIAGLGNDLLDGGAGDDDMTGGAGDDVYVVDSAGDVVRELAGGGTDTVQSSLASYTLAANLENLTLISTGIAGIGNALANVLTGNGSANILDGKGGADIMSGGGGDDTYYVDDAGDVIVDSSGIDGVITSISYTLAAGLGIETMTATDTPGLAPINLIGNEFNNRLVGNSGANILNGGGGNDRLEGNAGNDVLDGGAGADLMIGGMGDDTYTVDDAADVVSEAAGAGTDTVNAAITAYTLSNYVEKLVYTGAGGFAGTGSDTENEITGGSGNDTLLGMGGNDQLIGGLGNDWLDGGSGDDTMTGGIGDDTYTVDRANDVVVEGAGAGIDTVRASINYTLAANLENLTLLGTAVSAIGNELANVLTGNGSANILDGKAGADSMAGGAGDDIYYVDNAGDVIVEAVGQGTDKVIASLSYVLKAGVSAETLTTANDAGLDAINFTGNELANNLVGNAGANSLSGGAGDDRLEGLAGNDVLNGGAGTDLLIGGAGNDLYVITDANDTILEVASGGADTVSLTLAGGDYTLAAEVENLSIVSGNTIAHGNALANTIASSGAGNSLWGEGGDDVLRGGTGAETFHGGIGNDTINGGAGNDLIYGEAGNDLFVFATGHGVDEIADFTHGSDRIDLTGLGITGMSQLQALMTQNGANTVIGFAGGSSITLDNVTLSTLTTGDFVFAPGGNPNLAVTAALSGGPATVALDAHLWL